MISRIGRSPSRCAAATYTPEYSSFVRGSVVGRREVPGNAGARRSAQLAMVSKWISVHLSGFVAPAVLLPVQQALRACCFWRRPQPLHTPCPRPVGPCLHQSGLHRVGADIPRDADNLGLVTAPMIEPLACPEGARSSQNPIDLPRHIVLVLTEILQQLRAMPLVVPQQEVHVIRQDRNGYTLAIRVASQASRDWPSRSQVPRGE